MKDYYDFELLTPCFCHGATSEVCEMRIPSIRGHLRRWHTLLYGEADMEAIWGTAHGKVISSKVVLRLVSSEPQPDRTLNQQVLPHVKGGAKAFSRNALSPGNHYRILISFRPMSSDQVREKADQVIMSWLYLGGVGMRSTRAFGSVWPLDAKPNLAAFKNAVMVPGKKLAFVVSTQALTKIDLAICTDTLSGPLNEKFFGFVHGRERHTSPLKMKYIRLDDGYHLVLYAVSGELISGALKQLREANKRLGQMEFSEIYQGENRS